MPHRRSWMLGAAQPPDAPPVTRAVYTATPAPLPAPATGRSKQYGHFVLDNVKVNAMGVSCTIKRVRFMYKGDGIDADVAKCALTNGESEKKADVPRVLTDLLEKLDKKEEKPSAGSAAVSCPAAQGNT